MKAHSKKAISLILTVAMIFSLVIMTSAPALADYWGEPVPERFPRDRTTGPAAGGFPLASLVPTAVTTINNASAVTQAGGSLVGDTYVIENREFSGNVTVSLANVTLRGCYIPGRLTIGAGGGKADYCEIFGVAANSSGFEITNCDISNSTNIITVNGGVTSGRIEGNYIHDLAGDKRGLAINSYGGSVSGLVIKGNTILGGPDGYRNYINNTEMGNVSNLLFEGNYFSGPRMMVQFYVLPASDIQFKENVFSTFHSTAGSWGWLAVGDTNYLSNIILTDTTSGPFTFSGNNTLYPEVWEDGDDEWDPNTQYLIRFNANDGLMYTYNMPEGQRINGGQLIAEPAAPKRDGYDFGGWYKEASCGNAWNFTTDFVTRDMTIYAKWTRVGFRPPEIPYWYHPLDLPDTTVPNWQIGHEWPNETNVGLLTPKSELTPIYGALRSSSGGTPDLTWIENGVLQNPDNINPHENSTREWVTRQLNSKPDWPDNNNAALPGISSWTTWALKFGYVTVDENYITQNGGRVTDPASPDYGSFVIENKYINGGLRIDARNVIVRNCYIEACGALWGGGHVDSGVSNLTWGSQGAVYITAGASLTITNCEINGLEGVHAGIWNDGTRLVAMGNNIYNSNDGIYHWEGNLDCSNNYRIQDNYIHNFTDKTSNGHVDGWQAGGGSGAMTNGLFRHNNVRMGQFDSGAYANYGPGKYIQADYNLFFGAGYTIYTYSQNASPQTNTWFINNVFDDLNGESPRVGYYGIWYNQQPQDGWHRVSSKPSNYYPTVDIDPYNFPIETPSFRYGNIVRSTGVNVDIGNVGEPDLDQESPLPEGWWANSGSGSALLSQGQKDLGKSWTGEVTMEFKLLPLAYPLDSAIAYSHTGVTINDTANPWSSFNILGGARPNGVLGFYNGYGTGSGAWETQNKFNAAFPELTTDAQRAAKIAAMTSEELAVISPYLKKYEANKIYEIRIHADTNTKKYTVWARELGAGDNPVEDWFCIGENYGFRNVSGSDIRTLWVGPGGRFTYGVGDHEIYEGPPVEKGDKYELTVIAGENGSTSFERGEFVAGRNVTILATPNTGYKFAGWTIEEGSTAGGSFANANSAATTFKMPDGPAAIKANFAELEYFNINITAGEGGSVSPESGSYVENAAISLTATALPEYTFKNWTVEGGGTFADANSAATTFIPNGNATIKANFEPRVYYTATVIASEGGSVNIEGGKYEAGDRISLVAAADEDYNFSNWIATGGTFTDADSASTTFIMPEGDVTISANFDAKVYFNVSVVANEGGIVNKVSGNKYEAGDRINIVATAAPEYKFTGWTVDGSGSITNANNASTTFTVGEGNVSITANFEARVYYPLTVTMVEGGSINTAGGRHEAGDVVTLTAKARRGYRFTGWVVTPGEYSDNMENTNASSTTFTMPAGGVTVTAGFVPFDAPPEFEMVPYASSPLRSGQPDASLWYDHFDGQFGFSPSTGVGASSRWSRNWATGAVDQSGIGIFKQGQAGSSTYDLEKFYFNFIKPFVVETRLMFPVGATGNVSFDLTVAGSTVATVRLQDGVYNIYMKDEDKPANPVASVNPDEWFVLQAAIVPDMSKEDLSERWAGSTLTLIVDKGVPVYRIAPVNIVYSPNWGINTADTTATIRWRTKVPANQSGQTWYDSVNVYEVTEISAPDQLYTLDVSAADGGFTTNVSGEYAAGDTVYLVAAAAEGYAFTGWTVEGDYANAFEDAASAETIFTMPAGNAVVTANFVRVHTVTFVDWDGKVLDKQTVVDGTGAVTPDDPARIGYLFTGWDIDFTNITGNLTVTAQYELIHIESTEVSAYVAKLIGKKNDLKITIIEHYNDDSTVVFSETIAIKNNAAGTYEVGDYKVYVNTKGNIQIRECYIVK